MQAGTADFVYRNSTLKLAAAISDEFRFTVAKIDRAALVSKLDDGGRHGGDMTAMADTLDRFSETTLAQTRQHATWS